MIALGPFWGLFLSLKRRSRAIHSVFLLWENGIHAVDIVRIQRYAGRRGKALDLFRITDTDEDLEMAYRKRTGNRNFHRAAKRTDPRNQPRAVMRGGIRF